MAIVTGVTKAKMEEIRDSTIVSARVENGVLYFKKGNNVTEFDVGRIVPRPFEAWPVGSIYITTLNKNPAAADMLGGGTWQRWGRGRVPVSVDESQPTRFGSVEVEGGSPTHTLTVNEMPRHNHGGQTGNAGQHQHDYQVGHHEGPFVDRNSPPGSGIPFTAAGTVSTASAGDHVHGISQEGGGAPHNILQPYITAYMWKRTS